MFQVYHGLLFGLPAAVTSFNRWSKLAEALVRRLLVMLFSMYYDDASFQDWTTTADHAQEQLSKFMELLGAPWAPEKSQKCAPGANFLGLHHDCSRAHLGYVSFWPMPHLIEKVTNIIKVAREVGLGSGAASKLYGVTNFLETGMYSRVGRAGLDAIKCRQYEDESEVSQTLLDAFNLIQGLLQLQPRREYALFRGAVRRILVMTDASYEGGVGKAGFLVVANPGTPEVTRVGRRLDIPRELYRCWGNQQNYIAQLSW